MAEKPLNDMDDGELMGQFEIWKGHVETAGGWASACEAAKMLKSIVACLNRRGFSIENPYPIKKG